jgi:hypothetical protein
VEVSSKIKELLPASRKYLLAGMFSVIGRSQATSKAEINIRIISALKIVGVYKH